MKVSLLDVLLNALALGMILATSIGSVWLLAPLSRSLIGEYHVILDFFLLLLSYGLLSALMVRMLWRFRRIQPGEYSMDSNVFTYWKLLNIVYRMGQAALLPFTTIFMRPVIASLFGARIGSDVAIGGTIDDPFLVTLGDGAVLGFQSLVSGNVIYEGRLFCGEVNIGAGATIGVNAVILPDTVIGENAMVIGGSVVLRGTRIPAGEHWRGNPARKWIG
jgi:acetyltransferase-like isoleucine patch superfamily enzyme